MASAIFTNSDLGFVDLGQNYCTHVLFFFWNLFAEMTTLILICTKK